MYNMIWYWLNFWLNPRVKAAHHARATPGTGIWLKILKIQDLAKFLNPQAALEADLLAEAGTVGFV